MEAATQPDIARKCTRCTKMCEDLNYKTCARCRCLNQKLMDARKKLKCAAMDQTSKQCRRNAVNDTEFCDKHSFILGYTQYERDNMTQCTGCRHYQFCGEFKSCLQCRSRDKAPTVKCPPCKSTVKSTGKACTYSPLENGYCGKHQVEYWKDTQEKDGTKKACIQYIRGCRTLLSVHDSYARCLECRTAENNREAAVYAHKKNINDSVLDLELSLSDISEISGGNIKVPTNRDNLVCITCNTEKHRDLFRTLNGKTSHKCDTCLADQRDKDSLRDRTGRDYSEYEKQPHRIEAKHEWNLQNPEKQNEYTKRYRANKQETLGLELYHAQLTAYASEWRRRNPVAVRAQYARNKSNIDARIAIYKDKAAKRGTAYTLSDIDTSVLMSNPCHYCGVYPDVSVGFHGIDRKDNNVGYIPDNCVTACSLCNMMKGDIWNEHDFLRAVEHILAYHDFIPASAFPSVFVDYISPHISTSNVPVKISKADIIRISSNPCYICGKRNSRTNRNGVDRINSDICYVDYNCQPCCAICNYMKNGWKLHHIFAKLTHIHSHNFTPLATEHCERTYNKFYESLKQPAEIPLEDLVNSTKRVMGISAIQRNYPTQIMGGTCTDVSGVGSTILEDDLPTSVPLPQVASSVTPPPPVTPPRTSVQPSTVNKSSGMTSAIPSLVTPKKRQRSVYKSPEERKKGKLESNRLSEERRRAALGETEFRRQTAERVARSKALRKNQ